jgi:serine phosphatase RsbU (regulator of sigma subunit)
MGDVGVLQEAVLPVVPPRVGALALSVAHRPAGGPAAGGDFYDVVPLDGDRTALVVGDVTGHGPGALGQATLVRFTLRAHLESGAGPREALAIATESLAPHFEEGFATAAVAIHDPKAGTLTYATAAHEAPIVVGPGSHDPVLVASTPPLGIGAGGVSARRQTVVPFPEQSLACMLTDGALEARVRGELVGRARVEQWVRELGERPAAGDMAELIRSRAKVSDDLAVCFATSTAGADSGNWRVEELHRPTPDEAERFLTACGAGDEHKRAAVEALRFSREGTVLTVRFENDVVVSATVQRNGNPATVAA